MFAVQKSNERVQELERKVGLTNTEVETKQRENEQIVKKYTEELNRVRKSLSDAQLKEQETTKKYQVLEKKMSQLNEAYQKEKKELASAVK